MLINLKTESVLKFKFTVPLFYNLNIGERMSFKDFSIGVLITFIWGVNFSGIKLGLISLNPFVLTGLRFMLCAFPLVFFIKKPDVKMFYIISYGLIFGVGLWGMVTLGIYFGISAGVASLVLQMSVFFTIILGAIILNEKIDNSKKIGFIVSLLGLALIISVTDGSVTIGGIIFVLVGAISWSIANILVKHLGIKEMFSFIVWSSLFSPMPLFILAYYTAGSIVYIDFFKNLDSIAIFSILFQVYPTTLIGYWVWNSLLKKYPVSSVAPLSLLVPVFGLLGSYFIFNEEIGTLKVVACIFIVLGLLVNVFGKKMNLLRLKI